jgi:hypothetical protein
MGDPPRGHGGRGVSGRCRRPTSPVSPAAKRIYQAASADDRAGTHRVDSDEIGTDPRADRHHSRRALAHHVRRSDTQFDTADLSRRIGLGSSRSKLWQSLDRLHRFCCLTFVSTDVATIRLELPPRRCLIRRCWCRSSMSWSLLSTRRPQL